MSAPITPDAEDRPCPSPWRYRQWRRWCDEHGEGPYLYQYWGERRGRFVTLTLEQWMVGVEVTTPSNKECWVSLQVGPFGFHLALWSGQ